MVTNIATRWTFTENWPRTMEIRTSILQRTSFLFASVFNTENIGRVVKGVGHRGHDEAMEAGGREFDPRPGHYSRTSF